MHTSGEKPPKSLKAVVGAAHHALRAYVKAFEARSGQTDSFRYFVPPDGQTASILDSNGQSVLERPIQDWAQEGPPVRLSMIGLRSLQDELLQASRAANAPAVVRYDLNILDGRACLQIDGKALSREDLTELLGLTKLGDRAKALIPTLAADDLQTVAGWARIGRQVEIDFFQALQAAEAFSVEDAVAELRRQGERRGIIRRRKEGEPERK